MLHLLSSQYTFRNILRCYRIRVKASGYILVLGSKVQEEKVLNQPIEWIPVPEFLRRNKGRVDKNLVYREIAAGRLPAIRIGPKKILIRADAFDVLFEQGQSQSQTVIPE